MQSRLFYCADYTGFFGAAIFLGRIAYGLALEPGRCRLTSKACDKGQRFRMPQNELKYCPQRF
jgi:hypothetical protein